MTVAYVAGGDEVRFAYAIGRPVGPAVVRNRVRRRLRAAAREIDVARSGLPAGAYLVSVRPAAAQATVRLAPRRPRVGAGRGGRRPALPPGGPMTPAARLLHRGVRLYQRVTDGRPSPCRYVPTCSNYALDALEVHGAVKGSALTVRRLCRCHPWGGHGWDPVPEGKH